MKIIKCPYCKKITTYTLNSIGSTVTYLCDECKELLFLDDIETGENDYEKEKGKL